MCWGRVNPHAPHPACLADADSEAGCVSITQAGVWRVGLGPPGAQRRGSCLGAGSWGPGRTRKLLWEESLCSSVPAHRPHALARLPDPEHMAVGRSDRERHVQVLLPGCLLLLSLSAKGVFSHPEWSLFSSDLRALGAVSHRSVSPPVCHLPPPPAFRLHWKGVLPRGCGCRVPGCVSVGGGGDSGVHVFRVSLTASQREGP